MASSVTSPKRLPRIVFPGQIPPTAAWVLGAIVLVVAWSQVDPVYGYPSTEGFTGELGSWEQVTVNLNGVSDLSRVRLTFRSNASVASAGWYVDDVVVWDGDAVGPLLSSLTTLQDT